MKVKLELDNKKYEGEVEEIVETEEALLLQADGEKEVFVILDNVKHWIQNMETAEALNYDIYKRKQVPLVELNWYKTGDTFNMIGEPERARDIYYPKPEKPYPFKGLRGLLTLKPKPAKQQIIDTGFNAIMPYSGSVDWNGDYISIPANRPGPVILRFTGDELDCWQRDPGKEYQKYLDMKDETPDIMVGINLEGGIGCGLKDGCSSVAEYHDKMIELANKVDYVSLNVYPYREDWPDPLEKMESFYNFWKDNITVPIIPVIQAHWDYGQPGKKLTKPDPLEQVRFYFGKGLTAFIAYGWRDEFRGVADMQREWKAVNEWARKETI